MLFAQRECTEIPVGTLRSGETAMRTFYILRLFGSGHLPTLFHDLKGSFALFTLFNFHVLFSY